VGDWEFDILRHQPPSSLASLDFMPQLHAVGFLKAAKKAWSLMIVSSAIAK
jgi:hypothetical protein